MESECYYELYEYLVTPNSINYENGEPYIKIDHNQIPLPHFRYYSFRKSSKFIGECTRNFERYKNNQNIVFREYEHIKDKFNNQFSMQFGFDFDDPGKHFNLNVFPQNLINNDLEYAMKIKWHVFHEAITAIKKELNKKPDENKNVPQENTRRKAQQEDFRLELPEDLLVEFYLYLKEGRFIDEETSRDNFINAFTGYPTAKIKWTDDQYSLYILIQKLNNNNCFRRKLNDGKWKIVSDIFSANNKNGYFTPLTLAHSSPTKGKDYSTIEKIAGAIIELVHENDQFGH